MHNHIECFGYATLKQFIKHETRKTPSLPDFIDHSEKQNKINVNFDSSTDINYEIIFNTMTLDSDITTQIHKYHSLGQRYAGDKLPDLQLTLREYSNHSVEIEVTNLRYRVQRWQNIKHIWHVLCDLSFFIWFLYRTIKLFSLIQSEKVLFCSDFALQCHTIRFLCRTSNLFISANNIYDIVINEVIENLDVHYVLIIRTKGDLFQKKPIIALFNTIRPTFDCLRMIYKCLNKARHKASTI